MLLTLATHSFAGLLSNNGSKAGKIAGASLTMHDLPEYAIRQLNLRGLNVHTSMLAGWSLEDLERLRDYADKAACPCLVLVEDAPLQMMPATKGGSKGATPAAGVRDRIQRLALAANRLGCNALAVRFEAPDTDDAFELVAGEVRAMLPIVEQYEVNLLIAPHQGLTHTAERLTELIKRIGGFRIGCLPTFAHAAETADPIDTLRKLAPYAGAIHASVVGFDKSGAHKGYDLKAYIEAIRSVGFANTVAIEFTGSKDHVKSIETARAVLHDAISDDDTGENIAEVLEESLEDPEEVE
ncbi:MAG TPA: TIM barrel protein [Phycisphaerales bacterium]|nr:TIM barrel protein [Phycisphaerales bacterium]HRQ75932.1 TIM barrel protein [Phycisphaerales bacterium]